MNITWIWIYIYIIIVNFWQFILNQELNNSHEDIYKKSDVIGSDLNIYIQII